MRQRKIEFDLKTFFELHQAQRRILMFLLEHKIDSQHFIRLQEIIEKVDFNKNSSYRAIRSLHEKGWICFMRSTQIRASWIGYNEKLPDEFLRKLRTSLAQAEGFGSWCDYIMRTEVNRPNERTHTADTANSGQLKEIAKPKARSRSYERETKGVRPGRPAGNIPAIYEEQRNRLPGRPQRFDPQGVPLRIVQHDTHK